MQTITTRKLDEKNEVKVVRGIPNASIACCTTYQLHTGQAPLENPICLEEVTKKIEPSKWNVVAQIGNYAKFLGRYDSIERANEVISDCLGLIYRMPEE